MRWTSTRFVRTIALAASLAPSFGHEAPAQTVIRDALVVDGSGKPPVTASVRIVGDRIVAVGNVAAVPGDRVIEARGLALSPGFVDTHSHHNRGLFDRRDAIALVSQGVTTIVVGQDGSGSNLATLFARFDSLPAAVNLASYAGHGSIREAVMGTDFRRAATRDEIERMKALVRAEMEAGALGLSTGLEYDPGIYASTDEVVALAAVAAGMGGRYASHIRSEDRDFWSALDEAIHIGRVNRMPVQISHLKLGMQDLWGLSDSLIRRLDRARGSGVDVTADIYPYTYWQSNLGVFYPKRNFADSAETAFILAHLTPAEHIIFNSAPRHPDYVGRSLADVAEMRGTTPLRAMMDLLAEPEGADAGIVARGMDEADVQALVRWPWVNVCSDGQSMGLHPRGYGSFPKVLGRYVREAKLFPLEEAVRKMTSLAAANAGLKSRGVIASGYFADLVLFDPASVADNATFDRPQATATGIRTVWVNGEIVFDGGAPTGRFPGRVLRREAVNSP